MGDNDDYDFWDDEESIASGALGGVSGSKSGVGSRKPDGRTGGAVGSSGSRPMQGGTGGLSSGVRGSSSALPNPNNIVRGSGNGGRPAQQIVSTGNAQRSVTVQPDTDDFLFDSPVQENAGVGNAKSNKKKGKGSKKVLLVILLVALCGAGAYLYTNRNSQVEEPTGVDNTQGYLALESALRDYNPETIDSLVGVEEGDSYLAQEWAYANNNKARQLFIVNVCKQFAFGDDGTTVTIPDYQKIADEIATTDKETVNKMLVVSGYAIDDYTWNDECVNLLMRYFNERESIPVTNVGISSAPIGGTWADDVELDKLLFSSDAFHNMCDEFDKIVTGYTGFRDEEYYEDVEVHNDEYDRWEKLFKKYYDEDNGHFKKGVSKWEPWYLRDDNNKYILDENGKRIVNYYTVKDKNGKDWVQPAETIYVKEKKVRQVPVDYVAEYGVPHCFLGAYYCQNEYSGVLNPEMRVGDGTVEHPAGAGTPIITKVLCTDGMWHDVSVTLRGYWVGNDAITYAVTFSERNRGLDPNSVIQLITYEIEVKNLENNPITFDSEMVLCDKNLNQSSRTGTLYSFLNEGITLNSGEGQVINDWATSTEIAQKYVIWGKSFNRQFPSVYFLVLAGTGDIPSYSAYKAFTGESSMSGALNGTKIEADEEDVTPAVTGEGSDYESETSDEYDTDLGSEDLE